MAKATVGILYLICALVGMSNHNALADPSRLLKGIKSVSYLAIFEKGIGTGCKIDESRLNTSLQFIANQSTALKIITDHERTMRENELWHRAHDEAAKINAENERDGFSHFEENHKRLKAAFAPLDDHNHMPRLMIDFSPLQVGNGCAAEIDASLTASIEPTRVQATQADVYHESIEIWSSKYVFVSGQSIFSDQAIGTAEQMLKALVNDWTASQEP